MKIKKCYVALTVEEQDFDNCEFLRLRRFFFFLNGAEIGFVDLNETMEEVTYADGDIIELLEALGFKTKIEKGDYAAFNYLIRKYMVK
jgi:hypothetical protein